MSDVEPNIVIVAAGATIGPPDPTRRDQGETNRVVFEHSADQCITRLLNALFIVVSNPVESTVEILLGDRRKRVIGVFRRLTPWQSGRYQAQGFSSSLTLPCMHS